MHRSPDRGPLGRPRSEIDATATPTTRRERRRLRSTPEQPRTPHGDQYGSTTAEGTGTMSTGGAASSLATLFARSHAILPDGQPTILAVCTGNVCRSPLAEVVLRTRLSGLDVRVGSAGTHALVDHGMPAPARELAQKNGVPKQLADLHRATLLNEGIMTDADLILTMTGEQATQAVQLAPRCMRRTFTLLEFARLTASLTDAELRDAAARADNPRSRLSAVIVAVSGQRGATSRPVGDNDDVIDPYRQSAAVYARAADQMLPALAQVERAVRAAIV